MFLYTRSGLSVKMLTVFEERLGRTALPIATNSAGCEFFNGITGIDHFLTCFNEWYHSVQTREQTAATNQDYCGYCGKWRQTFYIGVVRLK